ncbi:MAG: DUF5076 domain-containing protein [Pyrinomonadaceae bacterium]
MSKHEELIIPNPALSDANSFELLRVWIANNGQHVSLRVGVWEDPAAWGIMLVDLARHIAKAHQQETGADLTETLGRIRAGLDAEWSSA